MWGKGSSWEALPRLGKCLRFPDSLLPLNLGASFSSHAFTPSPVLKLTFSCNLFFALSELLFLSVSAVVHAFYLLSRVYALSFFILSRSTVAL